MSNLLTKRKVDALLKVAAGGLALGTAFVAPNAVGVVLKRLDPILNSNARQKEFKRLLAYMERSQLVELRTTEDGASVMLTQKGIKRLNTLEITNITIAPQKVWDKKWRMVIFDIPRKRQTARANLLNHLHRLGFFQLKQSVWVYPFPCTDEILLLCEEFEITPYVTFAVAKIYSKDEKRLLAHFRTLLIT